MRTAAAWSLLARGRVAARPVSTEFRSEGMGGCKRCPERRIPAVQTSVRHFSRAGSKVSMAEVHHDQFCLGPTGRMFVASGYAPGQESFFFSKEESMVPASSAILVELFCCAAMQKQQAFRLINKSSTHLWCEKWNIYACQSNISVLQHHALLMPDGGWSKYQLV